MVKRIPKFQIGDLVEVQWFKPGATHKDPDPQTESGFIEITGRDDSCYEFIHIDTGRRDRRGREIIEVMCKGKLANKAAKVLYAIKSE